MYRPYLVGKMGSPAMSSGSRYETDQIALSRYADFHSVSISDHSHRNLCAGLVWFPGMSGTSVRRNQTLQRLFPLEAVNYSCFCLLRCGAVEVAPRESGCIERTKIQGLPP